MNKISKIKFLLTPILTAMLAFIMVVTSFSWYQIKSSEIKVEPQSVSVTTKAPEGDNAEIFPINDVYEFNKVTSNYIVANTGIINGYLGQTGLETDSADDRAYIIFYKVEVSSSDPDRFSTLDYAYVDSLEILDSNGNLMVSKDSETDSTDNYGLDEFRIIFLEKTDISSNSQYYFKKTNLMTPDVTDSTNNTITFFIGVQFHDNSTTRFPYSDTKYIGSKFKLNIKFDSSVNNSFYKIALFRKNAETEKYEEIDLYDYSEKSTATDSTGAYTQYKFKDTNKDHPFDIKPGDRIYGYNKLTRTYYDYFENWTNILDLNNDSTYDTYQIPEVPSTYSEDILNDYEFNIKVYANTVKIYNVCPFTQFFIKGGYNSWSNVQMDELTDPTNKARAIDLYKRIYAQDDTLISQMSYLKPLTINPFVVGSSKAGKAATWTQTNKDESVEKHEALNDNGALSYFDFDSNKNYPIYTTTFSTSTITEFCVFDSNEQYYKNSFNDSQGNYKLLNGEWRIYLLVIPEKEINDSTKVTITKTTTLGNSEPVVTTYEKNMAKYRSVVIYEKIGEVAADKVDFYIKGHMNSWSATEKYKLTYVEENVSVPYYWCKVYFDATFSNSDGTYSNYEFKFSDLTWGVSWSTDGFAINHVDSNGKSTVPTKVTDQLSALGLSDILTTRDYNSTGVYTPNNLRYYFGLNDDNSNMANIKIVRSGTYTFYMFYDVYITDTGDIVQDAYVFLVDYKEGNFAS